jgi:hypothetical protein
MKNMQMKMSPIGKFWMTLSLTTLSLGILTSTALADSAVHYGKKGTYTINDDGSYRGCLYKGGCITLSRKYLLKRVSDEQESIQWKKGEYVYSMGEGYIWVTKNNKVIFEDDALLR